MLTANCFDKIIVLKAQHFQEERLRIPYHHIQDVGNWHYYNYSRIFNKNPYAKDCVILNDDDKKVIQPDGLKNIDLFPHQLTMINRALDQEKYNINFKDLKFIEKKEISMEQYHNDIRRGNSNHLITDKVNLTFL